LKAAAQRISEHLLAEAPEEIIAFCFEQDLLQFVRALKALPCDQLAGGFDGEPRIFFPPGANAIVILETKSNRVHARMAGSAKRLGPMLLHSLAQRAC